MQSKPCYFFFLQKLWTFEGGTLIHYDFSVDSMLWIWNLHLSDMHRIQNPLSTKSCSLYPNLCNVESHLHFVLSAGSTLLEFVKNEGQKLQNLVWTKLLLCTLALHMSHLQDAKLNEHITFMTIHYNMERWWRTVINMPNIMVVHIKLLTYLFIFQKANLQRLYIVMSMWVKSVSQSKEGIVVKVCQWTHIQYCI